MAFTQKASRGRIRGSKLAALVVIGLAALAFSPVSASGLSTHMPFVDWRTSAAPMTVHDMEPAGPSISWATVTTDTLYLPVIFLHSPYFSFNYGVAVDPNGDQTANIGHLQTLGFRWVKLDMPWKDVEPASGSYQWARWDSAINSYSAAGFNVLLTISKAPAWARPRDDNRSVEGPPAHPATFAAFLSQVTQRYKGRVEAIEVWSGQNLWYMGGGSPIPPANYVALLSASYSAIKAVDQGVVVVSGAMTPAGAPMPYAIDDISYLNSMYAAGLKGVSDAIGAHPSGYNCPADADWQTVEDPTATFRGPFENRHHSWCFRGTMEGYRPVLVANGDSAKAIWPTEFGWAVSTDSEVGYEYARDNTYAEQSQWIVQAYQMSKGWGWVGPMFLWNLDYGLTAAGTELSYYSLLLPSGPVPAYYALAAMPK